MPASRRLAANQSGIAMTVSGLALQILYQIWFYFAHILDSARANEEDATSQKTHVRTTCGSGWAM